MKRKTYRRNLKKQELEIINLTTFKKLAYNCKSIKKGMIFLNKDYRSLNCKMMICFNKKT